MKVAGTEITYTAEFYFTFSKKFVMNCNAMIALQSHK